MMRRLRKYTDIHVLRHVYCNSLCQYSFTVICSDGKRRWTLEYSIGFGLIYWGKREGKGPTAKQFPKYVWNEVERLICEAHQKNQLVFYEYDRDRNKRHENYRYHSAELFQMEVGSLMKKTA